MKQRAIFSYFVLAAVLALLLNLPATIVQPLRSSLVPLGRLFAFGGAEEGIDLNAKLQAENQLLREEIVRIHALFTAEAHLEQEMQKLKELLSIAPDKEELISFYKRRTADLMARLEKEIYVLPARVIFREPGSWESALWVDRGEEDNRRLGCTIVAKNSPVIVGSSLVGVIEEVQERQSRVRLITDSHLTPAVRAVRGSTQYEILFQQLSLMQEEVKLHEELPAQPDILALLTEIESKLPSLEEHDRYLAKGELHGSSHPLWRSRASCLKGIGFNYEFPDQEGPAQPLHDKFSRLAGAREPLIKLGDLLITSGLDRLFPPGLHVATVSRISPLKEGAFAYDLEAIPTVGSLSSLTFVQILPPNL